MHLEIGRVLCLNLCLCLKYLVVSRNMRLILIRQIWWYEPGNTKGRRILVPLPSCLTGLESAVWQLTIFCFYLQNRLLQTSKAGGQVYSDTPPLVFPVWAFTCHFFKFHVSLLRNYNSYWCYDHYNQISFPTAGGALYIAQFS